MKKNSPIMIYADLLPMAESTSSFIDRQWQEARDRIINYLDALKIEPVEALELSLRVLAETRKKINTEGGGDPTVIAMRTLRQILSDQNRIDVADPARQVPDIISLPSAPPWNPGHMVSQRLDTSPWRTRRFMNFRWLIPYIGLLIFFAILYYII